MSKWRVSKVHWYRLVPYTFFKTSLISSHHVRHNFRPVIIIYTHLFGLISSLIHMFSFVYRSQSGQGELIFKRKQLLYKLYNISVPCKWLKWSLIERISESNCIVSYSQVASSTNISYRILYVVALWNNTIRRHITDEAELYRKPYIEDILFYSFSNLYDMVTVYRSSNN